MSARVPGATRLFDIVFIIVVINTLAQGPTLPWAARRLKVTAPAEPLDVDVKAAPLEALHADLLQVQIPPESRLHGVEIFELRLPARANIVLIVRDGKGFVPSPTTTLRTGDRLLIVASAVAREQTERRLRAVSRAGKLARWFGEHGQLPSYAGHPALLRRLRLRRPYFHDHNLTNESYRVGCPADSVPCGRRRVSTRPDWALELFSPRPCPRRCPGELIAAGMSCPPPGVSTAH
jgi:TrkA-C domain